MDSQKGAVQIAWYRGGQVLGADVPLTVVNGTGLECRITVPAGELLLGAQLTVPTPATDTPLVLRAIGQAAADAVSLPAGAVARSAGSGEQSWLTVDLGARRTLQALRVKVATTGAALRLKLADGAGPFYAAYPVNVVALTDDFVALPEMTASRILIELGTLTTTGKVFAPAAASVTQLDIQVAAGPPDLTAHIGSGSPFFQHPLPLPKTRPLTLREELLAALLSAWPADLAGGTVALILRASAPGTIALPELVLRTATVVRGFSGAAAMVQFPIRWDCVNQQAVDLPAGAGLAALKFRVDAELRGEQPLITRSPGDVTLRCAGGNLAALGFPALPAAVNLTAVDLCLKPLTSLIRGEITLHSDHSGQPDPVPLPGAMAQFTVEATELPPWDARWLRIELATAVALPPHTVCWVVVAVSDGVALWGPAASPVDPSGSDSGGDAVGWGFCPNGNPWRPVSSTAGAGVAWAGCRLRHRSPTPPLPRITLRGPAVVEVTPDAHGLISLLPEQLDALVKTRAEQAPSVTPLQLQIQVDAPVDGAVTLSDLWIQLK